LLKTQRLIPVVVIVAGLLAYHNSFTGPFIFDDVTSIRENATIRHLWPIWQPLSPPHRVPVDGRPVVILSLAINYALGGYDVRGYHVLNLIVHILAGLTLFGVVRRTLLQPRQRERFGVVANQLALAVAVLWTVHPLLTESVTYITQRTESLMGLFCLLTLYCVIRGAESTRPRVWYGLGVTACALGMASKEVMVAVPLVVLLYDWVFLASSFRDIWPRRTALYVGLAATWLILAVLVVAATPNPVVAFGIKGLTPWDYLKTEAGVIVYYLRLCFWPHPLVIDYFDWPIARSLKDALVPGIVVASLLGATAWAFRHRPRMAFLGAWFFLILAPTSSVLSIYGEVAAERRMYLPLAAVITMVAIGIHALAGWRSMPVFLGLAVGLGFLTVQRNEDYRSNIAIWLDTVNKRPNNSRAQYNLGVNLTLAGRVGEAIGHYEQALRVQPDLLEAHCNLGIALAQLGRLPEAIGHYEQALRIKPDYAEAHCNLGNALFRLGKPREAMGDWEQALRIKPDYAEAENNLAWHLATLAPTEGGDPVRAVTLAERACELTNDRVAAYLDTLAVAYAAAGRFNDAVAAAQKAIELAKAAGQVQLVKDIELHLELYRTGRAYRAPASVTSRHDP
jgi:tetratricopeptide (TPR) repeat protein